MHLYEIFYEIFSLRISWFKTNSELDIVLREISWMRTFLKLKIESEMKMNHPEKHRIIILMEGFYLSFCYKLLVSHYL